MKSISLTKSQITDLEIKKTNGFNSESTLYIYNRYLIKLFKYERALEDKRKTLYYLDFYRKVIQMNLPEINLPKFYVSVDDKFAGYGMPFVPGIDLKSYLESPMIRYSSKIQSLIKLGEFLEKLDELRRHSALNDFFIGDLHAGNVMVLPNGEIKLVDVDSMKIGDNEIPASFYLQQPYYSRMYQLKQKYSIFKDTILPSRETDIYMYIMIVLEFLSGKNLSVERYENFEYYVKKLRDAGVDKELINVFLSVYSMDENINPYRLLKRLDK